MILSLIGLPGVGKTAVGSLLGVLLEKQVIETDRLFEIECKCTIAEYFDAHGEAAFRDVEANLLAKALQSDNIILSTGGGVVLRAENRRLLRSLSCVVYLDSSPDYLVSRLAASTERPLFRAQDPLLRIRALWSDRAELYLQTAHFTICVENKSVEHIAEEVIDAAFSKT